MRFDSIATWGYLHIWGGWT